LPTCSTNKAPVSTGNELQSRSCNHRIVRQPGDCQGKVFEIKRSELDEVMTGLKSAAAAHGQAIPPGQLTQIEASCSTACPDSNF